MPLPAGARRLFTAHDLAGIGTPFLIARLLEDGDGADLGWLSGTVREAALADWLERHGARQLSRRSLAFWELVLDRRARPAEVPPPPYLPALAPLPRTAVWPL